jgi:hypothetical protein
MPIVQKCEGEDSGNVMKACRGSRGLAPLINHRMRWKLVEFTLRHFTIGEEPSYPLRKLDANQRAIV